MRPVADCREDDVFVVVRPARLCAHEWIAPIVRRFVFKGTVMTLVSWSFSASSRILGPPVGDPAFLDGGEIEDLGSDLAEGTRAFRCGSRPGRLGESPRSNGNRCRISTAHSTFFGSAWATSVSSVPPGSGMKCRVHQSPS